MTIGKAIEELERGTRQNRSTNNQALREALKLGIAALKRIQNNRLGLAPPVSFSLPGETD